MIIVGNQYISDDVKDEFFVCQLDKCKGACCVEGDLGAPLEDAELIELKNNIDVILPYLSEDGKAEIKKQGLYIKDWEGDYSTPTVKDRECAYAVYDEKGILKCGIEQSYLDGKSTFKKPISCHLYPIRVTKYEHYDALNYDRWSICSPACSNGKDLGVKVYEFLKEPLIRKYGESWYNELVNQIKEDETPTEKY